MYRRLASIKARMVTEVGIRPALFFYQKDIRMQVLVRDNNVEQALRVLKKKMQREGVFREMKLVALREAVGKRGPREGRSHPPRPQGSAQAGPARGIDPDSQACRASRSPAASRRAGVIARKQA